MSHCISHSDVILMHVHGPVFRNNKSLVDEVTMLHHLLEANHLVHILRFLPMLLLNVLSVSLLIRQDNASGRRALTLYQNYLGTSGSARRPQKKWPVLLMVTYRPSGNLHLPFGTLYKIVQSCTRSKMSKVHKVKS